MILNQTKCAVYVLSNAVACWRNIYAFRAVITVYCSLNGIYIAGDNKLLILLFSYTLLLPKRQCVSFVLWTYSYPSTDVHIESFVMAKQQYILFSIYILCIVELQMSLSTLLTYLGTYLRCSILLFDCNRTRTFSTDFRTSLQCQISRKFFNLERSWLMRTDWRTEGHGVGDGNFA